MVDGANEYGVDYARRQARKSPARRFVRSIYIRRLLRHVNGRTIDFGCGTGDVLRRLPSGSIGLDANTAAIEECARRGLSAFYYDSESDDYRLSPLVGLGKFDTLLACHVLEHLDKPVTRFNALLRSARQLGVTRAVVVVPGIAGFDSDPTHRVYVDREMLMCPEVLAETGMCSARFDYFPGKWPWIGKVFTYHELTAVFGSDA